MDYRTVYQTWLENASLYHEELSSMNESQIEDAFYKELEFGTAGLRGKIGPGTNRMNEYTVGRATQGLSDFLLSSCSGSCSVAISYDSRIKSDVFARLTASILAANGISVVIYPALMPVPCLSYATRYYKCNAGVMITASHNPAQYNGYKVYGSDGCQMTSKDCKAVLSCIGNVDTFTGVKTMDFDVAMAQGLVRYVDSECITSYVETVKALSCLYGDHVDRAVKIVYSPLNGSGLVPVLRVLNESGFTNITVVEEQRNPDGNFPTCPKPNPEMREALELGLQYSDRLGADLMLATDPDADRCGIAVRDGSMMRLLSGGEVGLLLIDYICSQKVKHGKMPTSPVMIKTIVTNALAEKIASHYGVRTINVLTGFKYIGEQIALLEKAGNPSSYLLGFEESYGYLSGTHVRDKDAVNASFLICEMFAYYKTRGIGIWEKLQSLYAQYGYCLSMTHYYAFEGSAGLEKMKSIMDSFRSGAVTSFGGLKVLQVLDYKDGLDGLPASNVVKFVLENDCLVILRPSGTEPKLNLYTSINAPDVEAANALMLSVKKSAEEVIL